MDEQSPEASLFSRPQPITIPKQPSANNSQVTSPTNRVGDGDRGSESDTTHSSPGQRRSTPRTVRTPKARFSNQNLLDSTQSSSGSEQHAKPSSPAHSNSNSHHIRNRAHSSSSATGTSSGQPLARNGSANSVSHETKEEADDSKHEKKTLRSMSSSLGSSFYNSRHFAKFSNYQSISHHLNWYLGLNDGVLQREYYTFNSTRKSGGFLLLLTSLTAVVLSPMQLYMFGRDIHSDDERLRPIRIFTSLVAFIAALTVAISGSLLYAKHFLGFRMRGKSMLYSFSTTLAESNYRTIDLVPYCFRLHEQPKPIEAGTDLEHAFQLSSHPSSSSAADQHNNHESTPVVPSEKGVAVEQQRRRRRVWNLVFALSAQLFFLTVFCRRVFSLNCFGNYTDTSGLLSLYANRQCYESATLPHVATTSALIMLSMPVLVLMNLPDTPIGLTWWNLGVSLALFVVAIVSIDAVVEALPVGLFWFAICVFTVVDVQTGNMLCFFANRSLSLTLRENERMAEETRVEDMRHMMANVAHDLKTVSKSVC